MVWSFTERDILHGLRERALPVNSLDHLALLEAARELVDALATRIRRERGQNE